MNVEKSILDLNKKIVKIFTCNYYHYIDFYIMTIMNTEFIEAERYKNTLKGDNHEWLNISFSELRVGDKIIIYFYPDSLKYINELFPKFGEVISIDPDTQNSDDEKVTIERVTLHNGVSNIKAYHPWCSYLGDSTGYYYDIYRLTEIIDVSDEKESDYEDCEEAGYDSYS